MEHGISDGIRSAGVFWGWCSRIGAGKVERGGQSASCPAVLFARNHRTGDLPAGRFTDLCSHRHPARGQALTAAPRTAPAHG